MIVGTDRGDSGPAKKLHRPCVPAPGHHPGTHGRADSDQEITTSAGSLLPFFESASADAESTIAYFSVLREINMRNAVYPHRLLETLRGLFSDPAANADCRAVLGFSGA
jgi:hypothetical protein